MTPTLRKIIVGLSVAVSVLGLTGRTVASPIDDVRPALPATGISASGVDVACTPTAARPVPVILIHGTRADRTVNWQYLGPELAALGYCVYSLDLPDRGQAPIAESVAALAARVDEVRSETGAQKVSLVGHSLGGLVARDYVLRGGGGTPERGAVPNEHGYRSGRLGIVDDVIAMGTPHTGYYTEPPGDQVDAAFNTSCPACWEMARGSSYMHGLNGGDMTPGTASYTSIITAYDGVAVPHDSQYLPEGPEVANVLLQEKCDLHVVDHLTLALDPLVRDWVVSALSRRGPADLARSIDCAPAP